MCELFLEHGADPNAATWMGWDALKLAVVAGNEQIVPLLLSRGAAVNAPTAKGRTALMAALALKNDRLAAILIKAGADVKAASQADVEFPTAIAE
jgi:ankyrin repeat protein